MTVEERFEAIESHLQSASERIDVLTKLHLEYAERQEETERRHSQQIERLTRIAADMKDITQRLANIAVAHEDRLDDHEKRIDDLEN